MMNLHKCEACRFQFNAKTRKPVMTAIIVYNVVLIVIALVVLLAVRGMF